LVLVEAGVVDREVKKGTNESKDPLVLVVADAVKAEVKKSPR
jgi:hypothetical protein